jgi:hypothetical protein
VTKKLKVNDLQVKEQKEIDIDGLTLRQARKVAKALNIRQKVNGKDQPKRKDCRTDYSKA